MAFRRIVLLLSAAIAAAAAGNRFTFAILGDRTGEAQPGIFEQIWKETAAEKPAFVITTGDSIEGLDDAAAERQWRAVERVWTPYRIPLYLAPGNHDVWSALSEQIYLRHAGRPLCYSFDHEGAHFTVLDNSRSDELPPEDLAFLEKDLKAHAAAPVKFVFSHRPSWIVHVALRNPDFPLQRLARQYGVQYVVAGHVHQMLRLELEGVTYISMPSSGGHLRLTRAYEDGWFFGHARVTVDGATVDFQIEDLKGHVTKLTDWGPAGLLQRQRAAGGSKSGRIPAR